MSGPHHADRSRDTSTSQALTFSPQPATVGSTATHTAQMNTNETLHLTYVIHALEGSGDALVRYPDPAIDGETATIVVPDWRDSDAIRRRIRAHWEAQRPGEVGDISSQPEPTGTFELVERERAGLGRWSAGDYVTYPTPP